MATTAGATEKKNHMTLQRMDNVGVGVDDLEAAIAFFTELGLELEGTAQIEASSRTAPSDSTASAASSR